MAAKRITTPRKLITPSLDAKLVNELHEYAERTHRTFRATVELLLAEALRSRVAND